MSERDGGCTGFHNSITGDVMGTVVQAHRIDKLIFQAPAFRPAAVVRRVSGGETEGEAFTGRAGEVERVLGGLRAGGAGLAVVGMGGVGKSALVRQAAAVAAADGWFPGGVFWVDLHGYSGDGQVAVPAAAVFGPLLRWLGLPGGEIPVDVGEQAAVYGRVLDRLAEQGKPMLLVLDNASSGIQVRDLLPRSGPHRVVVTSRTTLDLPRVSRLDLDVLDATAALALLDAVLRAHRGDDDRAAHPGAGELVGVCAGLPLALRIAAMLLVDEPGLDPAVLAGRLRQAPGVDGYARGEQALSAVFDASWRWLTEQRPEWARLLRMLCLVVGPDLSTEAAAALANQSPGHVRVALDGLRRAHLVRGTGPERWGLHDLVRDHTASVDAVPADDLQAAETRLLDHYTRTAAEAVAHLLAGAGHPVRTRFGDLDAALGWLDAERAGLIAAVTRAAATGRHARVTALSGLLTSYLDRRRYLTDWVTVAEHACTSAVQLSPGDQATAANNLGLALREVRRFAEAVAAHERARALYRAAGDQYGEGMAWNNLGSALLESRRFAEAVDSCQRARDRFRQLSDAHGEAIACNNLGLALAELGRFAEAVAAHERARDLHGETGDRNREGMAGNNLGLALTGLGRFSEAIETHQRAADLHRAAGDRFNEALAWNNLGLALAELGRFAEAVAAHERARDLHQQTGDRNREGMACNNLGLALAELGRFAEAVAAHERARDLHQQTGDRDNEGMACNNLGCALVELGRFAEAVTAYERARDLHRETGDRHNEHKAWNNLGRTLQSLGRLDEARDCWLRWRATAPVITDRGAALDAALGEIRNGTGTPDPADRRFR
ncbi:tetratricopeptide repeat protein [Goodfellowiella coeruleoviolacea]|uniref:tetratricopeptide repeat protein n=1 Tax=Goodfellowiella coeruleoviolacea TaxID=334858 RepID=UPI0020A3F240|nr:tetratricopeptide repeat protein [Goodfellowiella coeruleoviolacea]